MKLKFIALPVLVVSALLSCSKSDLNSTKETEIIVQADVAQTRAGYGGSILPDSFVMDVTQGADSKYDYSNVKMIKDVESNVYSPESPSVELLWAGTDYSAVNVKAMTIPYRMETVGSLMDVNVSLDQNDPEEILASDLLAANTSDGTIIVSNGKVYINFKHLMTKLEIRCNLGTGLNPGDVEIRSACLDNICVAGQFSYHDMEFPKSQTYSFDCVEMYHDESEHVFEAVFFPYVPTRNPKLMVDAVILGRECLMSCWISPKDNNGFVSGNKYTMTVTINDSSMSLGAISIDTDWKIDVDVDMELDDNIFATE